MQVLASRDQQRPTFSIASIAIALCATLAIGLLAGCPENMKGTAGTSTSGKANKGDAIGLIDQSKKSGSAIATMDGLTLTTGEVEARLNAQSAFVRSRFKDRAEKIKFVDQQLRVEVLAKEAMELGYHTSPEVQETLKKIIVQKLTREKFDSAVRPQEISDAELQAYYDAHKGEYNKAEMVRLAQIVIPFGLDAASKSKAEAIAKAVAKEASKEALLNDRKHFKDLVAKHSRDAETKSVGGDLRYLTKAQITEKFGSKMADAAFAMTEINAVVGPVEGKTGFHIIKRTGSRKEIVRTLDQVKNPIRNVLYREKRTENFDKYVNELKKKFNVKVFEDKIDEVKLAKTNSRTNAPKDPHGHGDRAVQPPGSKVPGHKRPGPKKRPGKRPGPKSPMSRSNK